MSDLDLLQLLADHGGAMPWSDLLNASGDINAANAFLLSLKERGYISGELRAHSSVRITPSGRKQLNELVNAKKEKEEREEQVRIDSERAHKDARASAIIEIAAIIIAVITLLVEIFPVS